MSTKVVRYFPRPQLYAGVAVAVLRMTFGHCRHPTVATTHSAKSQAVKHGSLTRPETNNGSIDETSKQAVEC